MVVYELPAQVDSTTLGGGGSNSPPNHTTQSRACRAHFVNRQLNQSWPLNSTTQSSSTVNNHTSLRRSCTMFSSNSFGALAMDDDPEPQAPAPAPAPAPAAAAPAGAATSRLIEGEDVDAEVGSRAEVTLMFSGSNSCGRITT